MKERDTLFSALSSMYLHWYAEGKPRGNGKHRFAHWCETLGGILELYNVDELNTNAAREKERVVQEEDPMNHFYTAVHQEFGDSPWRIKDVLTSPSPMRIAMSTVDTSTICSSGVLANAPENYRDDSATQK